MVYTAYTEDEYKEIPKKYKQEIVGIKSGSEILQPPLCPECGGDMMEVDEYLSCIDCGCCRNIRVLKR